MVQPIFQNNGYGLPFVSGEKSKLRQLSWGPAFEDFDWWAGAIATGNADADETLGLHYANDLVVAMKNHSIPVGSLHSIALDQIAYMHIPGMARVVEAFWYELEDQLQLGRAR